MKRLSVVLMGAILLNLLCSPALAVLRTITMTLDLSTTISTVPGVTFPIENWGDNEAWMQLTYDETSTQMHRYDDTPDASPYYDYTWDLSHGTNADFYSFFSDAEFEFSPNIWSVLAEHNEYDRSGQSYDIVYHQYHTPPGTTYFERMSDLYYINGAFDPALEVVDPLHFMQMNVYSMEGASVKTTEMRFGDPSATYVGPFVAPVPEPATMLLLGSGLVGLVGFRKKFKK